ncbi:MAG: HlyD family efflux transporter periplasmic adaptor subunit [Alphaproteobacteria bacterium]|nr:HlyD family efflux transporter periplasmic adaptor subunit [Alphaproteobacteria bacterium]
MVDRLYSHLRWLLPLLALSAAGYGLWWFARPAGLPQGFAASNGRIEAVEIDIATKVAGRVKSILVDEGALVRKGQVLAQMDTATLDAQLRESMAALAQASISVETAKNLMTQREAERGAAVAVVAQRMAELTVAGKRLRRALALRSSGAISHQAIDDSRAAFDGATASLRASQAQVSACDAALSFARSNVIAAHSGVDAARATIERIQADIDDSTLRAPRDGRVQYRVAQPGEVLAPGGVVLTMIDLHDVYITFFLPTAAAGRVALGADVRVVLDAAPQYVLPARVSFVADVAQFTPKTVETAEERQKLMFRVKAHFAPSLLRQHIRQIKTGLPGVAYVRLDPRVAWPADLQVRLP